MRAKLRIAWLLSTAVAASHAAPAPGAVIAGWDFSQWAGDNALITNATTFALQDTLDANYSNLDPTFNAGAESAAFGTLYFNGELGSTNVDETASFPVFAPTALGSLNSNLDAPVQDPGDNPFNSFSILRSEGQDFTHLLGMTASAALSVVFEGDLTSVPQSASGWSVSFGGKTFSGSSVIGIAFSTNGTAYTSFGSVTLNTTDRAFSVNLDPPEADRVFVRFTFDPSGGQPIIDNVAIEGTLVGEGDLDEDGIPDGSDNCPRWPNPLQRDTDGDQVGDDCQCGDTDNSGLVNTVDALQIARGEVPPSGQRADKCDVTGDGFCNTVDALKIARGEVSPGPGGQLCRAYLGE
jgi:hypothetical protein